eukprot:382865-Prymnesium_polylepis.2
MPAGHRSTLYESSRGGVRFEIGPGRTAQSRAARCPAATRSRSEGRHTPPRTAHLRSGRRRRRRSTAARAATCCCKGTRGVQTAALSPAARTCDRLERHDMHAARLELGERLRRVAAPLPRHVLVRAHRRPLDLRSAREAARADHARERPGNEKGSACASGALRAQGALRGGRALSRCRLRVLGRRRVAAQVEVGDAEAVGGAEDGADVKCRAQVVEHEHERQPQVLGPRRGRVVRRHEKVVVMAALGVPSLDREDEVEEVALVKVEP